MENEHELSYETLTRVYLGSYEHYKSVGAEVEYLEPGFELQGAKMVEMGRLRFLNFFNDPRIIREQRIAAYKGYRKKRGGAKGLVREVLKLENDVWKSRKLALVRWLSILMPRLNTSSQSESYTSTPSAWKSALVVTVKAPGQNQFFLLYFLKLQVGLCSTESLLPEVVLTTSIA
ncbi:hypothetical protein Tco_1448912 [Tanacetum coccineum]